MRNTNIYLQSSCVPLTCFTCLSTIYISSECCSQVLPAIPITYKLLPRTCLSSIIRNYPSTYLLSIYLSVILSSVYITISLYIYFVLSLHISTYLSSIYLFIYLYHLSSIYLYHLSITQPVFYDNLSIFCLYLLLICINHLPFIFLSSIYLPAYYLPVPICSHSANLSTCHHRTLLELVETGTLRPNPSAQWRPQGIGGPRAVRQLHTESRNNPREKCVAQAEELEAWSHLSPWMSDTELKDLVFALVGFCLS